MQQQVRNATEAVINQVCNSEEHTIVEAPPASGKTYNAVQLASEPFQKVTYFAGRVDLYEQAIEEAKEAGDIYFETIPSPYRDCPTFTDENNGDTEKAQRLYAKGLSGEDLHYLGWKNVYMPCHTEDDPCPYIAKKESVSERLEDVDFLIGNHQHAYNRHYTRNRIVLFDEFNPEPFIQRYPSNQASTDDDPSQIIETFIKSVDDIPFTDLTDLIEARAIKSEDWEVALDWFREHGATAETVSDVVEISSHEYNTGHDQSALLTCALLAMEKVGTGFELASEPQLWEDVGFDQKNLRCIRDRNTGEMIVLRPPLLKPAEQVVGLDALPVKRLWDTVLGCDFDLKQVISRKKLDEYLKQGLNMEVIQLANGMNHYSGGLISSRDRQRFSLIRALEGSRYPIITPKKALSEYQSRSLLHGCIERSTDEENGFENVDHEYRAQNYARVRSSNAFAEDSKGLISGSPFPGDNVVKQWAALCGEHTEPVRSEEHQNYGPSLEGFSGFGDNIYRHFTHNQVFQAILRFGRSAQRGDTPTVYVNTLAIPEWLSANELKIHDHIASIKRTSVLEELIRRKWIEAEPDWISIKDLRRNACERLLNEYPNKEPDNVTREWVRKIVRDGKLRELLKIHPSKGKYNTDVFEWVGNESLQTLPVPAGRADHLLKIDSTVFFVQVGPYK